MGRTNVVLDDALVERVMRLYGLRTKREAIDFALRQVAEEVDPYELALRLEGSYAVAELDVVRGSEPIDEL